MFIFNIGHFLAIFPLVLPKYLSFCVFDPHQPGVISFLFIVLSIAARAASITYKTIEPMNDTF